MKRTWIFLLNPFDNATKRSQKKMLKIANDHDARLEAEKLNDPVFQPLYDRFHPEVLVFRTLMTKRNTGLGVSKSKTQDVEELFDLLANNWIKKWE